MSIDYRLAPETKLPEILSDLEDAYVWVHRKGPELFHANTDRIVVMGGSAGGYLTLTTGFRVSPRPTALVAFWGYGDLSGDWYSKPSRFYLERELVTREQASEGWLGRILPMEKFDSRIVGIFICTVVNRGYGPRK